MKIVKAICTNKHFYNSAKFDKCPICSSEVSILVSEPVSEPVTTDDNTDVAVNNAVKVNIPVIRTHTDSTELNERTEILSPYSMGDEDKTVLLSDVDNTKD
jgi:hypothetical protein